LKINSEVLPIKKLKIFIGPAEIGKIGGTLANALREKGANVTVVKNCITPYQTGVSYDQTIQFDSQPALPRWFMKFNFFVKNFFGHDAFIFLFGKTLLSYNKDLPLLKLFRKKSLMWFLGSDIISYDAVAKEKEKKTGGLENNHVVLRKDDPEELQEKICMIRKVEKYVDYIIADPTIGHLLNRDYIGINHESGIHMPIDIINIRYNNIPNQVPIIIHAPTNEKKKGTKFITEALNQLEKEGYKFDFRLCKNMSNLQVRELLTAGDIAIDQLFSAAGGMFAIEAMAAGCAVLGGNVPALSGISDLPVLHTDIKNVYQNIRILLEKPDLRQELGRKGREYAEKYHDHTKIAGDIIKLFAGSN
jgi:hypothetical protein